MPRAILTTIAATLALAAPLPAGAAVFTVTSTADAVDATRGDGTCATAAGVCTLRAAIQEANALAGADAIALPAGTYALTLAGDGEDAGATGDLDVLGPLTIDGAGSTVTTVDGGRLDGVFHAGFNAQLTLSGLKVTHGRRTNGFGGGGILARSGLALDHVVVTANETGNGSGGGISAIGGELTIADSVVSDNTSGGGGGAGLYCQCTATIARTTVSGNSTTGSAGGILNQGTMTIVDSTISGNANTSPSNDGGGIYNTATITVRRSTLSGNSSGDGIGGGLAMAVPSFPASTSTLENVTFSANTGGGLSAYYSSNLVLRNVTITGTTTGAGLRFRNGSVTVANSIVAGNAVDCEGSASVTFEGHNLQGTTGCGFDVTGSAGLAPLGDNGGPVKTHALLPGSPALDGGGACPPPSVDARGTSRPQGAACDLGAYESEPLAAEPVVTVEALAQVGQFATATGTFALTVRVRTPGTVPLAGVSVAASGAPGIAFTLPSSGSIGTVAAGATEVVNGSARVEAGCEDRTYAYDVTVSYGSPSRTVTVRRSVVVLGSCGRVHGVVTIDSVVAGVRPAVGARVEVCPTQGEFPGALLPDCKSATTDESGAYAISGLLPATWDVRVAVPEPSPVEGLTDQDKGAWDFGPGVDRRVDAQLAPWQQPPADTHLANASTTAGGIPRAGWGNDVEIAKTGCAGGVLTWTLTQNGSILRTGTLAETPVGSGQYAGRTGVLRPLSGMTTLSFSLSCPGAPAQASAFNLYIDPSGVVRDLEGNAVVGATVTLFRADAPIGPWTQVPNGSAVMSPTNRRNPDTSGPGGFFGWDVTQGWYKVVAAKDGCAPAETAPLRIPPAVTDLDLRLRCTGSAPLPAAAPAPTDAPDPPAAVVVPATAAAPRREPAVVRLEAAGRATVARRGRTIAVSATLVASEAGPIRVTVTNGAGRGVELLPGSRVAGVTSRRAHAALVAVAPAGSTVAIRLLVAGRGWRGVHTIVVAPAAGNGRTLSIPVA